MHSLFLKLRGWAYVSERSPALRWREKRMQKMLELVNPPRRARVIDLGGTPLHWSLVDHDFRVTLVNLEREKQNRQLPEGFELAIADACDLTGVFEDDSFDLVFANSVIEHVGCECRQAAFAREVRRLAPRYWVQTPSDRCPIEPHTGVPFWWRRSGRYRQRRLEQWRPRRPKWTEDIERTRVLSEPRMQELFPDGALHVERMAGIEKSYAAYRPGRGERGSDGNGGWGVS